MRRLRMQYFILIILSFMSIISVGFATWVTTNDIAATDEITGIIEVEDVLKSNDYITCETNQISKFGFFKTGFVDKDGNVSSIGKINIPIIINIENCKNKFKNCTALEIDLSFESKNLYLFNSENNLTLSMTVLKDELEIESSQTSNNTTLLSIFDISNFNDLSNNITIYAIYNFQILNKDYFVNTIYPELLKEDFNFNLSARLSGKVE